MMKFLFSGKKKSNCMNDIDSNEHGKIILWPMNMITCPQKWRNWKINGENSHLQQLDALFNPNSGINKTFQIKF